jgi:transposase
VQPTIPVTFDVLSLNPTSASTPTSQEGATCQLLPKWTPIRAPDVSKVCGLDASAKNGLQTGDGRPLPARLKAEIMRELQRLELVLTMIAEIEAERDVIVNKVAPQHPSADKIKALAKLRLIGPEFATKLVGEVFYRSFDNRRQLGGFAGMAPSPYSSGSMERDQGISKAGSPMVRTTMIELAWLWLKYQPGSALSI